MREETEGFIREHHMAEPGAQILAAVSGGADSVCLLYVLAQMREDWNLKLRAFHVNHGLRGEEADRDRRLAQRTAEKLSVPFAWVQVDVKGFQTKEGFSQEEAARILRYEALFAEAQKWEQESGFPVKIAVAHQQEDNAETVLHHLFRGSGLRGLSGIPPVRERIIRPLLWASGEEIREFLSREGIEFCVDSTNNSQTYTRNRIRHQILPLISSGINSQAVPHICQAAARIAQADEYLEIQAGKWLDLHGKREPGKIMAKAEKLLEEPEIIRSYVLRRMVQETGNGMKDLSARHIKGLEDLLEKQSGRQADLPDGLKAVREGEYLVLEQKKEEMGEQPYPPQVEYSVFSLEKGMKFPENQYTKWFDYDRINGALSVRTRQAGDYFYLPGGGRKTVKSYMIDEKIPAAERNRIFLLAEGSHILWIIGKRISEKAKITPQTRRVLQVHVSGGEENGR